MDPVVIAALMAATLLGFANGSNDVSKAIATLTGAGVTTYRRALVWGAIWTGIGAGLSMWLAKALLRTFVSGWFAKGTHVPATLAIAVGVGAIAWVLLATKTGLPVSTTHALAGAIIGLGAVTLGDLGDAANRDVLAFAVCLHAREEHSPAHRDRDLHDRRTHHLLPLLARLVDPSRELTLCVAVKQPALSLQGAGNVLSYQGLDAQPAGSATLRGPGAAAAEICVYLPTFVKLNANRLHWLSSAGIAFTRALNDTPKMVAIVAMAALAEGFNLAGLKSLTFGGVALAMTLGSLTGHVVARRMGEKVCCLTEVDGFIANLVTAGLVGAAANLGLPVSTTHVSNGAIVGVGLRRGAREVSWKTVRDFVLAWVVTLPAGALLALVAYFLIRPFLG